MSCLNRRDWDWHRQPTSRAWTHEDKPKRPDLRLVRKDADDPCAADDDSPSVLKSEFERHADKWLVDTENSSSIHQAVMHDSYQRIIGMGRPVLPLIFKRLADAPNHWFWALRAITGENPVDPADAGRIKKMAEAWLQWARERRLTK